MKRLAIITGLSVAVGLVAAACGGASPTATPVPTTAPPTATRTAATATPATAATATRAPAAPTATTVSAAPTNTPVGPAPTATARPTAVPTLAPPQPTQAPAATFKRGGVLKQGDRPTASRSFQRGLRNPQLGAANPSATRLIYQSLLQYDMYENNQLRGLLAQSWEFSPAADQVTLRLRPDARWADGKPVTAQDVKFNLDAWSKPPTGFTGIRAAADSVASVEVINDATARVNLKGPDVAFLAVLGNSDALLRPSHRTLELSATDPVGSGGYKVQDVQPDVKFVFVKNPNSWMKDAQGNALPYIDGIESIIITETARAYAAMLTGGIDLINLNWSDAVAGKADDIKQRMPQAFVQVKFSGNFGWGVKNVPPFNNPQVMKAFHLVTDRLALVELARGKQGVFDGPGVMPASSGSEWALPMKEILSAPGFRYLNKRTGELETDMFKLQAGLSAVYDKDPKDIEAAKALLKQAGFDPPSKLPKLTLMSPQPFPDHAVVVAETLRKSLGMSVDVNVTDYAAFMENMRLGKFEGVVFTIYGGNAEPSQSLYGFTTGNAMWKHDFQAPDLDALWQRQRREVDPVKRKEIIYEFQRKILAGVHVFPGSILRGPAGLVREQVKNFSVPVITQESNVEALDRVWLER